MNRFHSRNPPGCVREPAALSPAITDTWGQFGKVSNSSEPSTVTNNLDIGLTPAGSGNLAPKVVDFQSSNVRDWPELDLSDVFSRAAHQKRRPREDRGLPPDEELRKLAEVYLKCQHKFWPKLVHSGFLPAPTDDTLASMVSDFKARHRTGWVDPKSIEVLIRHCESLGGAYARYSCDNSDPQSVPDQIEKALTRAFQDNCYVPWEYIFCDYSVTGLDAARQGYCSYKQVLEDEEQKITTTYIDDFSRASRDELEWWQLAAISKRLNKNMISASDNFNLRDPDWEMKLTMYGLLSRLFIKSLRRKVMRGMERKAPRGGTMGRPPFGFTRKAVRDGAGQRVLDTDGLPKTEYCFDPGTRDAAFEIWEKFIVKRWTPFQIMKDFNARKVDNWDGWTEHTIRKILRNPAYLGVFIWKKTRREYNWDTKQYDVLSNPCREWKTYHDPALRMVPLEWWKQARRELGPEPKHLPKKKKRGEKVPHRNQENDRRAAKTLFHDILVCAYCNKKIRLCRSAGAYRDPYCPNGPGGKHGCKLSTSKAVKIIEERLLSFISKDLFTEGALEDLLQRVNTYIVEESTRPREDVKPKQARARQLLARIDKLVLKVESTEDQELSNGYDRRIKQLQKELNELQKELSQVERRDAPPPPPLDAAQIATYLQDLRAVLNLDVQVSNDLLRTLTGPIKISQAPLPSGRKRAAVWVATFEPNLLALLAQLGAQKNYPESAALNALTGRSPSEPTAVTLMLCHKPKYEVVAEDEAFKKLLEAGTNSCQISKILGLYYELVVNAVTFARTGVRPEPEAPADCRARRIKGRVRDTLEMFSCHKLQPPSQRLKSSPAISTSASRRTTWYSSTTTLMCCHAVSLMRVGRERQGGTSLIIQFFH